MPIISVSMYPGRSKEQKADFAKAITNAAVQILGTKPEHVIVIYNENSKENWFLSGMSI
jgi:4-oxalocrotonate tautomerase